jgi:hypothetical protein
MKTAATEDKQAVESTACLKVARQIGFKSGTIFHEKQGQATVMQRRWQMRCGSGVAWPQARPARPGKRARKAGQPRMASLWVA